VSVDDVSVVDLITADPGDPRITLVISDNLPWADEEHLDILEKKLGAYVSFVESGQLVDLRPDAAGRPVGIRLICRHAPDARALRFLHAARKALEMNGLGFSWAMLRTD
jgi:hypothetical protein